MKFKLAGLPFLSSLFCVPASASVLCMPNNPDMPIKTTSPLAPLNISAGVDMPNGTIIYRGSWFNGQPERSHLSCNSTNMPEIADIAIYYSLTHAPMPLSSWTGYPFGGQVYETGIPGIGVAMTHNNTGITLERPILDQGTIKHMSITTPNFGLKLVNRTVFVNLIKTGPISPGRYSLNALNIPSANLYFTNADGYAPVFTSPIVGYEFNFSGSVNVNAQTCNTHDRVITIGKYSTESSFNNIADTTEWKNASIQLSDCPAFYGYYNESNTAELYNYNKGGQGTIPDSINNSLGVRLAPNTAVVDAQQGIMDIDTGSSASASGVGIQIGWGDTPTPFDFTQEYTYKLPKDGRRDVTIPLFARYIKTSDTVTPGEANGKLTFTINYY
ncbi:fimbrial protein [Klebsiella variicola]|uniref:fimbrial protein n=1 Tax=Klebsiella variicola TaxID=244366 RepID=UPI001BAAF10A|nr:fimbrial protein [Klebsiella variicola]MBR7370681.1 type 1 fimbrial protein [Klebsiella variicola]